MQKTNKEFTFKGKKYIQVYKENYDPKKEDPCLGCVGRVYASSNPKQSGKICDEANKHDDCLKNDLALIWIEEKE